MDTEYQQLPWPPGSSDMAERIRAFDWSQTPLGSSERWSTRLKLMVELVLASPSVSSLVCGPDYLLIYNDAAARLYGEHHPAALGQPLPETFANGWRTVAPFYERAFSGETVEVRDQALDTRGEGRAKDVFDAVLTPIRDEAGSVAYVHMVGEEASARRQADAELREREARQAFLLAFSDALRVEPSAEAVAERAIRMLFDHMQLDRCYITFYRPHDDAADFPFQVGNNSVPAMPGTVRLSDFPEAYKQVRDTTFILHDDHERTGLSEAEKANSKALGMRAMLASTARGRSKEPLSSLVAVSAQPRRWTHGEIALVEDAAERTWAVMERASAEAELREIDQRYRLFFEATNVALVILEFEFDESGRPTDFRHVHINPALERISGFKPGDILGRLVTEMAPPDEAAEWINFYAPVLTSGVPVVLERFSPTMNRWIKVSAARFGPRQVAAVFENTTAQKDAEQALRESEERQAFLLKFSDAVRPMVDERKIVDLAVAMLAQELNADRVYIPVFTREDDRAEIISQISRPGVKPHPTTARLSDYPSLLKHMTEKTLVIRDAGAEPGLANADRQALAGVETAALIGAALRHGPRHPIWMLVVASTTPRK